MSELKKNGLDDCIEAFERLKAGNPVRAEHIGLRRSEFTAAKVSWEAGLDRGYLKKSRQKHKEIIRNIEAYSKGISSKEEELEQVIKKADKDVHEAQKQANSSKELLDLALARELILISKIKELEQKIKMLQSPLGRI